MCTLSWRRDPSGYELHFNRDERHSRAPAAPPRLLRSEGVRALAPRDGDFGGAWIGVNEDGLAVALLNGWHLPDQDRESFRSRGLLVLDALSAGGLDALRDFLGNAGLARYRPFTLCGFEMEASEALRADWTGRSLEMRALCDEERPLISSSYRYGTVVETRSGVFHRLAGPDPDAASLESFHASHLPERGPLSTCMHREDASTKSYSVISVSGRAARFRYFDAAPCETGRLHEERLSLRAARRP